MKAHVLTGSKTEIAESVARMEGKIQEVIVFVEDPADLNLDQGGEDIFAEMEPYTVKVGAADCGRESLYARMEGE